MDIHEYQAKKIFRRFGIPVLKGEVAYTSAEAARIAAKMDAKEWVVKAQVYSSMRGEGRFKEKEAGAKGGIRAASSVKMVQKEADRMLGKTLVTPMTSAKGQEVKKVYIEEKITIAKTYALSIYIDFPAEKVFLTAQDLTIGDKPISFRKELDLAKNLTPSQALKIATKMGMKKGHIKKTAKILQAMYEIFKTYAAFKIEINPLVVTSTNSLIALDGKIAFDPDAVSRYKEVNDMRDKEEETPNELKARQNNFRYIKLNGNIGCIINGSGLGIATLDLIHLYGGTPACILDLGGDPTKEIVAHAIKTILSEPDVEGILINIFGGSTRCDVVAEGLIAAAKEISVGLPIVVRIDGTNEQMGCRLLFESGLPFIVKKDMDEAIKLIIQSVQEIM